MGFFLSKTYLVRFKIQLKWYTFY